MHTRKQQQQQPPTTWNNGQFQTTNPFVSKVPRFPTEEDTVKNFYSFLKTYKKLKFVHYTEGWSLKVQEENEDLKNLASQPLSEEIIQTLGDVKKEHDFQTDWFKKQ